MRSDTSSSAVCSSEQLKGDGSASDWSPRVDCGNESEWIQMALVLNEIDHLDHR